MALTADDLVSFSALGDGPAKTDSWEEGVVLSFSAAGRASAEDEEEDDADDDALGIVVAKF